MKLKTWAGTRRTGAGEAVAVEISKLEEIMAARLQQAAQTLHLTFWDKSGVPAADACAVTSAASAPCSA
jgi:hypothetical protein